MTEQLCNDPTCPRVRAGEIHQAHDLSEHHAQKFESIKKLIDAGTDITGGTVGAVIGLAVAGPPGAIVGGIVGSVAGHALKNVGNDYAERFLGPREQVRVGATIIFAGQKIEKYLRSGIPLRDDDFFTDKTNERSTAKEIVEGILLASQKEHEEKKIPYYATLFAKIAFSPGISRGHANLLISLAQRLTYRQLCLLSLFAQKEKFNLRKENYRQQNTLSIATSALLNEVSELEHLGLLNSGNVVFGLTDIMPGRMNVEGQGEMLVKLMELITINQEELDELARLLR